MIKTVIELMILKKYKCVLKLACVCILIGIVVFRYKREKGLIAWSQNVWLYQKVKEDIKISICRYTESDRTFEGKWTWCLLV